MLSTAIVRNGWAYNSATDGLSMLLFSQVRYSEGLFADWQPKGLFPTLVSRPRRRAFAAVAALRVSRRFTIRSATVVAGLLGMAVILSEPASAALFGLEAIAPSASDDGRQSSGKSVRAAIS